jgi:hypothetical protein
MLRILALDVTDRPSGESIKPHRKILRGVKDVDNLINKSVSLWDDFEGLSMVPRTNRQNSARMTAIVVLVAAGFMNRTQPACPNVSASLPAATSSQTTCGHGERRCCTTVKDWFRARFIHLLCHISMSVVYRCGEIEHCCLLNVLEAREIGDRSVLSPQ